ncbi:MAG: hypothetical protein UY85_C0012G0004 [Candidatus Peribacteria bacterium GW2011_GWB1_54_5]|nr:MAG: hypothetical protein UY87_C0067G0011 [Candidatus Peribacteria bacterium GW2011_GWC2_54_8]KKW39181.1 MAG: hypothetical protein UY85_C0012G0004 [Candidatus Peribacteria bacterium GW2011_GWB1_54_5]
MTFVYVKGAHGNWVANGTGFFIGVKNENDPKISNVYLVTAKHVIHSGGSLILPLAIRLNKFEGNAQVTEISLKEGDVIMHPDPDVDLAVIGCLPDQKIFDFLMLPQELICEKKVIENEKICEGDEVFFAGLFTSHVGQKQNQPIIRFGKIALMSDEKIEWRDTKDKPAKLLDLYLLECQSFGGNSGSPVFFHLVPLRTGNLVLGGGPKIFLGGVMRGSFLNLNEIQVVKTQKSAISVENLGVAAVTPAYFLQEILFSEDLIKARKAGTPKPQSSN